MNKANLARPALFVRRPPARALLLLACTLTFAACGDDRGSDARPETGAQGLREEPGGTAGIEDREGTLDTRRPSGEPDVVAGRADESEDQTLHGGDDDPGSQDLFQRWRLSEEPGVVIGGADERDGYLLHQVAAATRLGDGRIVVANGGSLELRYYDAEGKHLLSAAGEGEGPGELKPPLDHFTRLPGDSILVASFWSGFIRFGPDGEYASSIPYELPPRGRCWQFAGNDLLPDGSLLLRYMGTSRFTETDEPCPELGEGRPLVVFGRYVPGTAMGIDTIAVLPGFEWTGSPYDQHAYPRDLVFGIADDRLYLGDTGSDRILVISFAGDTLGTLPAPFEPAPVPADARANPFEDVTVSDGERAWSERITYMYPDHYPRYGRLVAAPGDRVWVMAYPPLKKPVYPQELVYAIGTHRLSEGARWRVVDADGLFVAEVRTPPNFFLLEVGDDYVLGLHKDELHRESVRVYRLVH